MKKALMLMLLSSLLWNHSAFAWDDYVVRNYYEQVMEQQRLEIEALQDDEVGRQKDAYWHSEQQRQDEEE